MKVSLTPIQNIILLIAYRGKLKKEIDRIEIKYREELNLLYIFELLTKTHKLTEKGKNKVDLALLSVKKKSIQIRVN